MLLTNIFVINCTGSIAFVPIVFCCLNVYYLWISYPQFIHRSMLQSIWKAFLEYHEEHSQKNPILLSLLKQTHLLEITDTQVTIACINLGMSTFFEKRIIQIELSLSAYFKKSMKPIFVVRGSERKKEEPLLKYEPSLNDLYSRAGLHEKYRFDNFAVSSSNNVAFAAAQAVSQNPGDSYNPLFFYGGVGIGKTHLAQAVGRAILEKNGEKRVYFCPGDRFTNELIESIQNKTTQKFRRKYRYLDIFIIDDVQFIAGKQTIQEEFFNTFNTVVSAGGQIILTSDRPPHEIKNLEDRLRSRFSGGLIVDLQPPDFELRAAILLIKAKEKNIPIQMDAVKVIAEQISDTRALEGTLLSLYAKTVGKKDEIDLEDVDSYFRGSVEKRAVKTSPSDIIHAVCSYYNIKPTAIKNPGRSDAVAVPRQVIMYLLRRELHMKFDEIARLLKKKDHTTVMYGCNKIAAQCMKNPSFKEEVDRIVQSLIQ